MSSTTWVVILIVALAGAIWIISAKPKDKKPQTKGGGGPGEENQDKPGGGGPGEENNGGGGG